MPKRYLEPPLPSYRITTPEGLWRAVISKDRLRELALPNPSQAATLARLPELTPHAGALAAKLLRILPLRMNGTPIDLPWEAFDLTGRPPFFTRVWRVMHRIPFGELRSYAWVASKSGSPQGMRAVGQSCGANPIVLFIPCHRVIATHGPGGFGAGMAWKERLLAWEHCELPARKNSSQDVRPFPTPHRGTR